MICEDEIKLFINIRESNLQDFIDKVAFAVLTMLSFLGCFAWASISFFLLTGLFIALLIPYIRHYYILENGVQKLYEYYDCLQHSI